MQPRRLGRIDDVLLSIGGVIMLVLILVALDPRVREGATHFANSGQTPPEVSGVVHRVRELAWFMTGVIRDQAVDHGSLMIFGIAAIVLVAFMLRT